MCSHTCNGGKPTCVGCGKTPDEISEYQHEATVEGVTPSHFVRYMEGTYNPATDRFACTACYIRLGCPSSPQGWKA